MQQSIHPYRTLISRLRRPPGPLHRRPRLPSIPFIFFSFFFLWRKRRTPRPVPSPSCSPPLDRPRRLADFSFSFCSVVSSLSMRRESWLRLPDGALLWLRICGLPGGHGPLNPFFSFFFLYPLGRGGSGEESESDGFTDRQNTRSFLWGEAVDPSGLGSGCGDG